MFKTSLLSGDEKLKWWEWDVASYYPGYNMSSCLLQDWEVGCWRRVIIVKQNKTERDIWANEVHSAEGLSGLCVICCPWSLTPAAGPCGWGTGWVNNRSRWSRWSRCSGSCYGVINQHECMLCGFILKQTHTHLLFVTCKETVMTVYYLQSFQLSSLPSQNNSGL